MSIAALALALAGGGIAAAKPTGGVAETAASGQQPAVTAASLKSARAALAKGDSLGTQAVGFYATVVNANGTKSRGDGLVIKYGVGQYEVQFGSNVTSAIVVATIGRPDSCCIPPGGEISVAPRLLTSNGVFIQTRNSTGSPADRPFHLVVHR
ncbi:hypothetical protein [Micromonospora zingiberis]|uniref:hypothetical protein n=1 Tax=Micromonospora zingiberis TaxID=2053011 RepID=UPI001F0E2DE6|nr:hypothetical protein [Micromonospora zingiberis]